MTGLARFAPASWAIVLALVTSACTTLAPRPAAPVSMRVPSNVAPHTSDLGKALADTATTMLGQPYRYGGAAPGGFDCSGLVEYASASVGLRVPRTALEQRRASMPISRRELRAGDLVFMHLTRKELHVGIALDGDRFVHAPSTGGRVRIDALDAAPYAHGFLEARRIVMDSQAP